MLTALSGYDARDPFSLDEDVDFLPATRRSIKGMRIAYSPDLDVFPVDPRIAKVVGEAVEAFEEAGATSRRSSSASSATSASSPTSGAG